jgi:hypothetical protein
LQAIERMPFSNDWMTLILLLLFLIVFLLSMIDAARFQEVISKLFKISFLEAQIDESYPIFSGFHMLFTLFSVTVISLLLFDVKVFYFGINSSNFKEFYSVFSVVFLFFSLKYIIENILIYLFMLRNTLSYFVVSKANYFFGISCFLFIFLVLKEYANLNHIFIYYFTGFLFFISFIFHLLNNKKLIINYLFYFILYICAFEIAPLLILIKLMF